MKDIPLQYMFAINKLDSDHVPMLLFLGSETRIAEIIEKKTTAGIDFSAYLEDNMPKTPPVQNFPAAERSSSNVHDAVGILIEHSSRSREG